MMDVVLKLRELRRMRGLTQKEVGESSGVGEKTLSSFETGDRITSLKLTQLLQLLAVYDMSVAEFFGGGVERRVFGELARLDSEETHLIGALRELPPDVRSALAERFMLMIEAAMLAATPRLRAVHS